VGCGRVAAKNELLRIAIARRADGARVAVADERAVMPGRGAYLCRVAGQSRPAETCVALAAKRGGIARTLRAQVPLDPKLVESVSR
jgi:predicted RNA-binding protein YlxR (DUF448 family)